MSGLSKAALIPRAFLRDGHMFTCCVRDPVCAPCRVFSFSGGSLRIAPHVRPSLLKSNVVTTLQSKRGQQSRWLQLSMLGYYRITLWAWWGTLVPRRRETSPIPWGSGCLRCLLLSEQLRHGAFLPYPLPRERLHVLSLELGRNLRQAHHLCTHLPEPCQAWRPARMPSPRRGCVTSVDTL